MRLTIRFDDHHHTLYADLSSGEETDDISFSSVQGKLQEAGYHHVHLHPKTINELCTNARQGKECSLVLHKVVDATVTQEVLKHLDGVLVSGLFDEDRLALTDTVLSWQPGSVQLSVEKDISHLQGDLLYFGLQIWFDGRPVCQAGQCHNWSYVWTPRTGNRFLLRFEPAARGMQVRFYWTG